MDANSPILFFDSGVGGLTVLEPTLEVLPNAPIVYAADSAGFPYGTKTEAELAARVPALLGRLVERFKPRLAVIACNTASTVALEHVRAALDIPVVGTVPAIKPAAELSKTRVIGVLGTPATVRQPYVDDLTARFAADCTVLRYGSSALVEIAEEALQGIQPSLEQVGFELSMLINQPNGDEIDVIVNACTHFPLLEGDLIAMAPRGVQFIDGGPGIARRIAFLTREQSWPNAPKPGTAIFTGVGPAPKLREALARGGLTDIQTL